MRLALILAMGTWMGLASAADYKIEEVTLEVTPTLVKKATVKTSEAGATLQKFLSLVYGFIQTKHILMNGAPYARYFTWDSGGVTEMEAGIPAITQQVLEQGIVPSVLPAGRALTTLHVGPYESIGPAYEALHKWMDDHQLTPGVGPWEVYLSDPSQVPPQEIQTRVYYPLK